MSVNLAWITVTQMPCAPMWTEALSASATLGLRVMELPASVSLKNLKATLLAIVCMKFLQQKCVARPSCIYKQKYIFHHV